MTAFEGVYPWWVWLGGGFTFGCGAAMTALWALGRWAGARPYIPNPWEK